MSIALDTLILFLFILVPGIVFRRFYFQGEFTKQFNSKTLAHSIMASILPGILIQYITANIYQSYWSDIDGESIKSFYADIAKNVLPKNLFDLELLLKVLGYIGLMLLVSWVFAMLCWGFVRVFRVDRWFTVLRFRNHWNYYFNGEIKGFRNYKGTISGKLVEVRADILVRIENEQPRLYSGVVKDYTINNDHELEYVYLSNAAIYKRDKGDTTGKRILKNIPGDIFVVSAQDIINLNLNYITTDYNRNGYSSFFNVIVFFSLLFVMVSQQDYFLSNTIIKTILIKTFFVIYFLMISVLFRFIFFEPKSEERNSGIIGAFIIILFLSLSYYLLRFVIF